MIRPSRRAGRLRRSPRKRRCGGSRRRDGVRSRLREAPASSCGSGTSPSRCSRHVQRGTGVAYRGAAEGYGARRRREREATPDAAAVSFTRWSTTRSGKKTEDAPNAGEWTARSTQARRSIGNCANRRRAVGAGRFRRGFGRARPGAACVSGGDDAGARESGVCVEPCPPFHRLVRERAERLLVL
jgi:hypothetical protein